MKLPEKLLNIEPYDPSVDKFDVKLDANESRPASPRRSPKSS